MDADGSTAIVGHILGAGGAGTAWLIDVDSGQTLHQLVGSDVVYGHLFGASVAVDGEWALVASQITQKAYAFHVASGQQAWILTPTDAPVAGMKIDVSGSTAVAGGGSAVYVFDLTTGQQVRKIDVPSGVDSVALDGNMLVVGSVYDSSQGPAFSGAARVFDLTSGAEVTTLRPSDPASLDFFGYRVGIRGGYAVVGAPEDDNQNGVNAGSCYVFNATTGLQILKLIAPDQTGWLGSTVSIAPPLVTSNGYLFTLPTGTWIGSAPVSVLLDGGAAVGQAGYFDLQKTVKSACCLGTICISLTEPDCSAAGGTYAGVGVLCPDAKCSGELRPACPEDINRDGKVDGADLAMLLAAWGSCVD